MHGDVEGSKRNCALLGVGWNSSKRLFGGPFLTTVHIFELEMMGEAESDREEQEEHSFDSGNFVVVELRYPISF